MKNYRCVFTYTGGNTTIEVTADDGTHAIEVAAAAISAGDYDRVDVWDGEDLLITKNTVRAWDSLGDSPDASLCGTATANAEHPPPATSHPRRTAASLAATLKGLGSTTARGQRKSGRKA